MKLGWKTFATTVAMLGLLFAPAQAHVTSNMAIVLTMTVDHQSLVDHHTDKYRMTLTNGFVIRRGFPFTVEVTTNGPLADGQKLKVEIHGKDSNPAQQFSQTFLGSSENINNQYKVELSTPVDSAVGKFEKAVVSVIAADGSVVEEYHHTKPVFVIFNPYHKDDQVYLEDEKKREEYLMNEYGKIYNGWADNYFSYKWFYAQFDELTLNAVFHLIAHMTGDHSNVTEIAKFISVNQGWYADDNDPTDITGNKKIGLVEGKWSDDKRIYPGGRDPESWVSTRDLLLEWQETGRAAKYGQCYIFGALQNSLLRTLGVATRQLSAFDARIDQSASFYPDKKQHHIINNYYDKSGNRVKNEGQIWNFHSWNDLWLHNVLGEAEGWCSLDGTPPGSNAGPGPLKLTYDLKEVVYTITDMISTTKSAERHILVECESKDMCDMKKVIKFNTFGCRKIVTSQPLGGGEEIITHEYTDPKKNAYIPMPHDPWHPEKPKEPESEEKKSQTLEMDVKLDAPTGIVVGNDIEAVATILLRRVASENEERPELKIDVNVIGELQTHRGQSLREIGRNTESLVLEMDADYKEVRLPLTLTAQSYLDSNMHTAPFVELRVFASLQSEHLAAVDITKVHLRAPELKLNANSAMQSNGESHITVKAHVENPHPFALERVCVTVHTPHLAHVGSNVVGDSVVECIALEPQASHSLVFSLRNDKQNVNQHTIIAQVASDFVPTFTTHIDIDSSEMANEYLSTVLELMDGTQMRPDTNREQVRLTGA